MLPLDMFWVRLGDDKALPFPNVLTKTVDVKASMFMLTPGVGVRLLDEQKIKCDFLTGFRYWHFGQTLNFNPSTLNLNFSAAQDWVDPLVGGRIESPLSSQDCGDRLRRCWRMGDRFSTGVSGGRRFGLQVEGDDNVAGGVSFLAVDYRGGGVRQPLLDVHLSGVLLGLTFNLK